MPNVPKKPTDERLTISKRMLFFSGCLVLVVGFVLGTRSEVIGTALAPFVGIKTTNKTIDLSSVEQTYQRLVANYDGKLDTQALIDGANHGLVAAAGDKFTVYLTADEANSLTKDLNGDVGAGIGAEITTRNGQPIISKLLPNNPAEAAGLQAKDVIISVNGEVAKGWTADKTASKIRGKAGTTLRLVVQRGGQDKTYDLTRAVINNPSVTSEVKNGIGVMTISRFDDQTGVLARKAAQDLVNQHVRGIVLDLRGDGGGYIDTAIDVASLWLTSDQLVVSQREHGQTIRKSYANGNPLLGKLKTVVLVDRDTASASEIVSAALRDNHKATLLGETTYGKGSVQQIITLSGGAELKVTVAHWYTPNGKNVGSKGLVPNSVVKMTQSDINAGKDPQLDAAFGQLGVK